MLPHAGRPHHAAHHPVHITVRALRGAPHLRAPVVFRTIERELRAASRNGMRIIAFSVQRTHVHLIVEASDRVVLWRGLQRFESRVAILVNRVAGRRGQFWRERYHREALTSPRQVRNTYVYVLMNVRKHDADDREALAHHLATLDRCSSARWFHGWHPRAGPPPDALAHPPLLPPVAAPQTWLARRGWKTWGLLRFDEVPKARAGSSAASRAQALA